MIGGVKIQFGETASTAGAVNNADLLPKRHFCARFSKAFRRTFVFLITFMGIAGVLQIMAGSEPGVPQFFLGLTGMGLLMLPTLLSYRCDVDESALREYYLVLFIPRRNEVLWRDVRSKKVRRDKLGCPLSIKLYNEKGRKVFYVGETVTGLGPITRMAKKIPNRS